MSKRGAQRAGVASVQPEEKRPKLTENVTPIDTEMSTNSVQKEDVDPELLKLLGEEPTGLQDWGAEIDSKLAEEWNSYVTDKAMKTEKEQLKNKYPVPKNLSALKPPLMNTELEVLGKNAVTRREDRYIFNIQRSISAAVCALARAADNMMKANVPPAVKDQVAPFVTDASKILCHSFSMLTNSRRAQVESCVDKQLKEIIRESVTDEYLCGKDLTERLRDRGTKKPPQPKKEIEVKTEPEETMDTTTGEEPTEYIDPELVALLGDVPVKTEKVDEKKEEEPAGPEIHSALASRWVKFLKSGVDKKEIEELTQKYLIPKNIEGLRSPKLNPELLSKLESTQKKEDETVQNTQRNMGVGLTAIAMAIDAVLRGELESNDIKTTLLPRIIDGGKILCDTFKSLTSHRKYHVQMSLDTKYRPIIRQSDTGEFLCGNDLAAKLQVIDQEYKHKFSDARSSGSFNPKGSSQSGTVSPAKRGRFVKREGGRVPESGIRPQGRPGGRHQDSFRGRGSHGFRSGGQAFRSEGMRSGGNWSQKPPSLMSQRVAWSPWM